VVKKRVASQMGRVSISRLSAKPPRFWTGSLRIRSRRCPERPSSTPLARNLSESPRRSPGSYQTDATPSHSAKFPRPQAGRPRGSTAPRGAEPAAYHRLLPAPPRHHVLRSTPTFDHRVGATIRGSARRRFPSSRIHSSTFNSGAQRRVQLWSAEPGGSASLHVEGFAHRIRTTPGARAGTPMKPSGTMRCPEGVTGRNASTESVTLSDAPMRVRHNAALRLLPV